MNDEASKHALAVFRKAQGWWRLALNNLLGWPESRVAAWASKFETLIILDKIDTFTSESPAWYMTELLIPASLAERMETWPPVEQKRLRSGLKSAIEGEGDEANSCYADPHYDWDAAARRIEAVLAEYGERLPSPNEQQMLREKERERFADAKRWWEVCLRELLGWPKSRVMEWARNFEASVESGWFSRETPASYVVELLIPEELRSEMERRGLKEQIRLEAAIRGTIEMAPGVEYWSCYSDPNYDWRAAKHRIQSILSQYSVQLPEQESNA